MIRFARLVPVLFLLAASASSVAQMGNPANGPTKIPDNQLDPARNLSSSELESAVHRALPEQYIWTVADSMPLRPTINTSWQKTYGNDLAPHYFRRVFFLQTVPAHATLYLAGPRRAAIYVNGKELGHYQLNPDFPMALRVNEFDVTNSLRVGKNVLAIKAIRGLDNGAGATNRLSMQQERGEVLAAMIIPAARGIAAAPLMMSDGQWKATLDAVPADWQELNFNDTSWPAAEDLGGIESTINFFQWNRDAGMYAWPGYDGISPFLAHYVLQANEVSRVYAGVGTIRNARSLIGRTPGKELTVTLPAQSVRLENAPQILLDFGREVTGRIELQSDSDYPAEVAVSYGESEAEALMQPFLGIDPIYLPPHGTAYGPKSAFRYAIVRFTGGRDTRFRSIRLDGIAYPVKYIGSFDSSDPQLNKMWAIGAYTAHLCMQDDIWDAPKRDRGRYSGDLNVSGQTINDVFGDHFLMRDTLNRLIGPAPVERHVNGISGYSAFWVIDEKEYYLHSGEMKQLRSVHTRMVQLLEYMEKSLDKRNLFSNLSHGWVFIDWSPGMNGYGPQTRKATQFEYYEAFKDGAYLLRILHDQGNARRMEQEADKLKAAAQSYMLNRRGSFGDRWQPNAYAVLSGVANKDQYATIWHNSLSNVGRMKYNPYIITPYYNFYVVSAMAKMGHRKAALNWIRKYWGGMMREGATSFWEGYDPTWYNGFDFHESLQADGRSGFFVSLAHGWSSGVTPWLMTQVLGIQPTAGGFSQVNIRPDLLGLKWARGSEPTPHGLLKVSIRKNKGYVTTIQLPRDVGARVSVPVPSSNARLKVNGRIVQSTLADNGRRAVVELSGKGIYVVTAE
jgi:hypothetical protein